jgi:DNA polymerase-1
MKKLAVKDIFRRYQKPNRKKDLPLSFYTRTETQTLLEAIKNNSTTFNKLKTFNSPYLLIANGSSLKKVCLRLQKARVIGLDCETTGIDPYKSRVRCLQIAVPKHPVVIIDLNALAPNELEPLRSLLASNCLKVGHNLKFDCTMLLRSRLPVSPPLFDTYLAYKVLTAGLKKTYSLEAVAKKLLYIQLDKTEQKSDFTGTLTPSQLQYAASDAAIVLPLYRVLKHKLQQASLLATARTEFACIGAVVEMELNGIYLDLDRWKRLSVSLRDRQDKLQKSLQEQLKPKESDRISLIPELATTINLRSPTQVITALDRIGIKVKSTNAQELIPLAQEYPIIRQLLEYRSIAARVSTFTDRLSDRIHPVTGRIHGNWWQMGAKSGRFSCSKPNLTNIPRDKQTRECFRASPGNVFIKADYSQIELRLIAKISGDERMGYAYRRGIDLHKLTASLLFERSTKSVTKEERRLGKIVNFGLIYGMGVEKFCNTTARDYGIYLSKLVAKEFREKFFEYYTGVKAYHERTRALWQKGVRVSRTLDGRRRVWSSRKSPTLNELLNHPIQGTNATIIKRAIATLMKYKQKYALNCQLVAVVHDEILLECSIEEARKTGIILEKCTIDAATSLLHPIPVEVDIQIASSWGG